MTTRLLLVKPRPAIVFKAMMSEKDNRPRSPERDKDGVSEGVFNEAPSDLAERFCEKPFDHAEVEEGRLFVCCPTHVPVSVEYVGEHDRIKGAFNSPVVQDIRESILDGSFRYCNKKLCARIQTNSLPLRAEVANSRHRNIIDRHTVAGLDPVVFNLCYDDSCNLSCPSCRAELRFVGSGSVYDARKKIQDDVVRYAFGEPHARHLSVDITGSGDPFGSKLFRELLFNLDGSRYPNVRINLCTNGLGFTARTWEKLHKIHGNIGAIEVSIDAGNEQDYAVTRRGGDWGVLMDNLEFLGRRRRDGLFRSFVFCFIIQRDNYRGMPDCARIGKRVGADTVSFTRLLDWGSWEKDEFVARAVWRRDNPLFEDFLRVMADPIMEDPVVASTVQPYRKEAVARLARGPASAETERRRLPEYGVASEEHGTGGEGKRIGNDG